MRDGAVSRTDCIYLQREWDRGVWCADMRQHLHTVRRVLMVATTTVTHRVQLLTNPIARSSSDGLYCAIHIIHDVPGAFVVTSCGSDGNDGPHRWRRTDRSVVFARWHQCTGIYMVTQTHAISLPDDVSIGSSVSAWLATKLLQSKLRWLLFTNRGYKCSTSLFLRPISVNCSHQFLLRLPFPNGKTSTHTDHAT